MEITACPVCGSTNIGIGMLGDGIISGLSSWNEVCRNCGYQGASLIFESEAEYQRFLTALQKQRQSHEDTKKGDSDVQKQHKTEDIEITPRKRSYVFEFIVSVVLTIVFFIILSLSNYLGVYSGVFSQNSLGAIVGYIIGSFVGVFLFFFLVIVAGEMLMRTIRGKKI